MLNPEIKKIYDLTAHQNRTLLSPDQFVKLFDGKQIVIECIQNIPAQIEIVVFVYALEKIR